MYNAQQCAERIKERAKSQKILIKDMLKECELSKNALSSMLSRGSWLQANNLARIADYLDCSTDYLLCRTDNPQINSSKLYNFEDHALPVDDLPVIGKVAAGQPILAIENPLSFTSRINRLVNYALLIKGDSMAPVIRDGETVQVISQKTLENGEIGIIKIDDSATCKRFYRNEYSIRLISFNPAYEPLIYDSTSSTNIQILGKVVLTNEQEARLDG